MEPKEIIAKVKKIEICTRHLVDELTAGAYHSTFKGKGVEFAEVREYVDGDEIRDIDWNVTAKMNNLFVKQFTEERELNVFVLLDISASNFMRDVKQGHRDLAIELASLFIFSAIRNNDRVGMMLFSSVEELHIPFRKGRNHGLRLLREMVACEAKNKKTDINLALQTFMKLTKKRSTVFLISDLLDKDFSKNMQMIKQKHDLIIIHLHNNPKNDFPIKGFVNVEDSEQEFLSSFIGHSKGQKKYRERVQEQITQNIEICYKTGVDIISITEGESYIPALRNFFKKRGGK